jgi:hypothetical protein
MLGADYLELLAVPRPHPALQYFSDFLAHSEGLGAIAFATSSADASHVALARSGLHAAPPLDVSRPIELPDGTRTASFRVVLLPGDATPGSLTFLCQHFTREHVWRPEYQAHPLGATAIAELAIIDEDPIAGAERYAKILGVSPEPTDDGALVRTGSAAITFAPRSRLEHRLEGVSLPSRPPPLVAALFLRVADRSATAATLRQSGVTPRPLRDGSLALDAEHAHGVALVFV